MTRRRRRVRPGPPSRHRCVAGGGSGRWPSLRRPRRGDARERRDPARRARRLRDVGDASTEDQRRPRAARAHRRQPRRRACRSRAPHAGLVDGDHRAGSGDRHRPLVRRRAQRPRRVPGHDGTGAPGTRREPVGLAVPAHDGARPGRGRGALRRRRGDRPLGRRARRLDGRHAGARVGRDGARAGGAAVAARARPRRRRPTRSPGRLPQIAAIREDPGWHGGDYHDRPRGQGPHVGLGVARRIAHITYRTGEEYDTRFGRAPAGEDRDGGRYAVESYLDHHAEKLVHRFDAGSYVALTLAMNGHDVGRGRGGVAAALGRVTARTVVAGFDSDRLYPLAQQQQLADCPRAARCRSIESPYGHDGFLIEATPWARWSATCSAPDWVGRSSIHRVAGDAPGRGSGRRTTGRTRRAVTSRSV